MVPLRVLFIEGSEADAHLIEAHLRRSGLDVETARVASADALRAVLAGRPWDVILADHNLPGLTAEQALGILRAAGLDWPFIIVSGTLDEETAVPALKAGAHDFVNKSRLARLAPAIERSRREVAAREARRLAERHLEEQEASFRLLFASNPHPMWVYDRETLAFLEVNEAAVKHYGYSRDEFLRLTIADIRPPEDLSRLRDALHETSTTMRLKRRPFRHRLKDDRLIDVEIASHSLPFAGRPATLAVAIDVTEARRAEEQIQRQIEQLETIHAIDQVITGSLDVQLTLGILLEQLTRRLRVDAAAVLLLEPASQRLEVRASRGMLTAEVQNARLRLGEGYAGRAALERRPIIVPRLEARYPGPSQLAQLLAREGVVGLYAAPLIAKGQLLGVLEVFYRRPFDPDAEWVSYMGTLVGQAAVAVENAQLFERLQRSTAELLAAYDSAIEGWSYALDLRDKETEGHSLRVTQVALRLARQLGLDDAALTHLRRGALLHDIGKLGVPDRILLKPGPLNDDEWTIMRRHPELAHAMLARSSYLHPALDIPYCHHERWDGSGYPRGLRGEEIPLAARIFAVVDVWDALRSARPYRPAWSEAQVRAHLQEQVGKLFDPRIVRAFLELDVADIERPEEDERRMTDDR